MISFKTSNLRRLNQNLNYNQLEKINSLVEFF